MLESKTTAGLMRNLQEVPAENFSEDSVYVILLYIVVRVIWCCCLPRGLWLLVSVIKHIRSSTAEGVGSP